MELTKTLILDIELYLKKNYEEEIVYAIRDCSYNDCRSNTSAEAECLNLNISLDRINTFIDETWQETVLRLIDEKELKDSYVYKKASISKQTFSKIRSNVNYQPNKDTAIQICFGLELNLDNSLDLLSKAGFTLSKSIKRDVVIKYFLEHEIYDIDVINEYFYKMNYKLFPIN